MLLPVYSLQRHYWLPIVSTKCPHVSPTIELERICLLDCSGCDVPSAAKDVKHEYDFLDCALPQPLDRDASEEEAKLMLLSQLMALP